MEFSPFTEKVPFRKLLEDESYMYDKQCPKCGRPSMIGRWSWSKIRHVGYRCSSPECGYGNEKAK